MISALRTWSLCCWVDPLLSVDVSPTQLHWLVSWGAININFNMAVPYKTSQIAFALIDPEICSYSFAMGNKTLPLGSKASLVIAAATTASSWMTVPYLVSGFIFYAFLCNVLRFRRRDAMHRKYYYPDRKSLGTMTSVDAQQITTYFSELEFPKIYYTSVQFALFKVYILLA